MRVIFFLLSFVFAGQALAQDKPNMLIIWGDDIGFWNLSTNNMGMMGYDTPNIDRIAEEGAKFTDYYGQQSCTAGRSAFILGQSPIRTGLTKVGSPGADLGIRPEDVTLASLLKDEGYVTAQFGKNHLGDKDEFLPTNHGFDEFFGFTHEGHYFVPPPYDGVTTMLRRRTLPGGSKGRWVGERGLIYSTHMGGNEPDYDANNPIVRGGQPVVESEYLTDALTREAVDFIRRHDDKPFFLYLAYNAVHSPLQGADAYMKKFAHIEDIHRRIFAAMLANLDDSVGAVMQQLAASGIEDNTIVFFLSDNGGPTRELTSSNLPLRGEKGQMYEGALRVPFMMQWKNQIPSGLVYKEPVSSMDLFTTAAKASHAAIPDKVEGVDLLPFIKDEQSGRPHETFYWRQGGRTALRYGDWKIVRMGSKYQAGGSWELYDLSSDLSEQQDLAKQKPDKLSELIERWESMNGKMAEPLFR